VNAVAMPYTAKTLTAELVEAFSGIFMSPRYDQPMPTPEFHRRGWEYYCTDNPAAALAAPRNHAKSTSFTHDFILANVCFRVEDYVILLGSSEEMAIEHLGDIATELRENEPLRQHFGIKGFITEQKTDIIVECIDGHQFRIIARGAEQKIRGRKWRGKRPGLIVGDDLEDDEQVESKDRRRKFSHWFFRAAKQALRDGGRIRVHGTILQEDSLLANLIKQWKGLLFKAHRSFDEFVDILWEEKFPEARLRGIRQEFIDRLDSGGYSQEYLNDPFDSDNAFIRKEDLLSMSHGDPDDYEKRDKKRMLFCASTDFAVSKADRANRTSITVGGKDPENMVYQVDQRVGRLNSLEIVEEHFSVQQRWNPHIFWVEAGAIWDTLWPMFKAEMIKRDIFINFVPMKSNKDKAVKGQPFQKRTRAGGFKVDKEASWYPNWEVEVLRFTGTAEATLDDQFDSSAQLCRGFEGIDVDYDDLIPEEQEEFMAMAQAARNVSGRSKHTGY
jgi:hypothetical protein